MLATIARRTPSGHGHMARRMAAALVVMTGVAGTAASRADGPADSAAEPADAARVIQAITVAAVPEHATETAVDASGHVLVNHQDGTLFRFGYARNQTGTVLGISDIVSQVTVSLGAGSPDYQGTTLLNGGVTERSAQGAVSLVEERANWRVGRQFTTGRLPVSLTPFVGVGEMLWLRDYSGEQVFSGYYHQSVEGGLAAHASFGSGWSVNIDGSAGRTLGAFLFNAGSNPYSGLDNARSQHFGLDIDRRWFDDWHQGLRIEHEVWRYSPQPGTSKLFEPLHRSDTAIMLVFSTERDLF